MVTYRTLVVTNLWPTVSDPGYGSFVEAQMESLRALGVDFDVLFVDGRKSRWNYLRAVGEMRQRLRRNRYDLIHAHFGLSGWVARCQLRVPVVVSFMGDDVLGRLKRDGRVSMVGRFFQASSFILARGVSAVIVKSRAMKAKLRSSSARVIPNGVDLDLFQPLDRTESRRKLNLDLQKKFVLFPFDPAIENKRYDLVEAAVARARSEVPDLEVLQIAKAPRNRMPLFMNAADVLVLASHTEGSPNAVKEAMAVNLPVITVNVGDVAELVGEGDGNYVVPRDADAIAAKIVEACLRGTRARSRVRMARLSMETVARQVVEVYAAVVRAR